MNDSKLREDLENQITDELIAADCDRHLFTDIAAHRKITTDTLISLFTEEMDKCIAYVIGEDEPQSENGLLPDRVDRRNQLRDEQRKRVKEWNGEN